MLRSHYRMEWDLNGPLPQLGCSRNKGERVTRKGRLNEKKNQEAESLSVYDRDLKKMVISTKIKNSSVFNSRNSSAISYHRPFPSEETNLM